MTFSHCIIGSSWIPRNSWPARHQRTQSECLHFWLQLHSSVIKPALLITVFALWNYVINVLILCSPHSLSLSLQGYPGLDGTKGETGAVGSKVCFYCCSVFVPSVKILSNIVGGLYVVNPIKRKLILVNCPFFRGSLVLPERLALLDQWCVSVHLPLLQHLKYNRCSPASQVTKA